MNFSGVGRDSVADPELSGSHVSHEEGEGEGAGVSGVDSSPVFGRGDEEDSTTSRFEHGFDICL